MNNLDILEKTYNNIKIILNNFGFLIKPYKEISYGIQFVVSKNNVDEVIRIYCNQKGRINYDYSQIHNPLFKRKILELLPYSESSENTPQSHLANKIESIIPIIGTDESGKGDYFGPLVTAGVFMNFNIKQKLKELGVKDSKTLNDKQNLDLSFKIKNVLNGHFAIIEISPEKYNNLYDQFKKEGKNLNTLLAWGHAKALEEILLKIDCNHAISDKFADEKFILGKLQERGKKLNLIQIHKAESNLAVAAASILARARFLEKLEKLSLEFNIKFPKGASQSVVNTANIFVSKYNKEKLYKVAKLHFKTTLQITTAND